MASSERAKGATQTAAQTAAGAAASAARAPESGRMGAGQLRQGAEGLGGSSGSASAEGRARLDGLRCDLLMNARYHASREAFLNSVHRILMFLIILSGASATADLFPEKPWVRGALAAAAAAFAALDLTADLSNRARCHALMKRRYFELLADLAAERKSEAEIEERMHSYSADEEPAFHALLALCWNAAQEMVYGSKRHQYDVPMYQRLLKNVLRFGRTNYDFHDGTKPAAA